MKKYSISINGCDDSTYFNLAMTEEEHSFLLKVAALSKDNSSYGCQPTMEINEAFEEESE